MNDEVRIETVYETGDHPNDIALVNEINRILHEHYPGWQWGVDIPPHQNMVYVRNLDLDPSGQVGMKCYKNSIDVNMKEIVRAGGELLERYRMRRGKYDAAELDSKNMRFVRADGDPRLNKLSAKLKAKIESDNG